MNLVEWSLYKNSLDSPHAIFVLGAINFHKMRKILEFFNKVTGEPIAILEIKSNEEPSSVSDGFYCHFVDYNKNKVFWDNLIEYAYSVNRRIG